LGEEFIASVVCAVNLLLGFAHFERLRIPETRKSAAVTDWFALDF
jgi:hypothetical protein